MDTFSRIESSLELRKRVVSTPEWRNCPHVTIVEWSGLQLADVRSFASKFDEKSPESDAEFLWHVVKLSVREEDGSPVFCDAHKEKVLSGPLAPLQRIFLAALELNGQTETAREDIAGN